MTTEKYDAIIVGGGFFGCNVALHLGVRGKRVLILEKEADLMTRASYNNQARVHGGYHYTRSLLTALRSRVSLADFVAEYEDCIDNSFDKYYAIARTFSKISAKHFYLFSKRIGADIEKAPAHINRYFNNDLIEDVYKVKEYAFDSLKLREHMRRKLIAAGVEYRLQTEAIALTTTKHYITLQTQNARGTLTNFRSIEVFNCAYAHINKLNAGSGLPCIPLKHELTEMALIKVPEELQHIGITIMDGPFFSVMPFPPRGLHTLSHVRYTPHVAWHDYTNEGTWRNGHHYLAHNQPMSAYTKMISDAKRYIPLLGQVHYIDSLWEVKTILPSSEHSDSRPILFAPNHGGIPGYTCIMGGKIDNVQDMLGEIDILHDG